MQSDNSPFNFDFRYDAEFKMVFTGDSPTSRAALTGLLSAFLERKLSVVSITANELPVALAGQRQIRYDIAVSFDDGELADIEMMLHPVLADKIRMEYYIACLFASQDIKGAEKDFGDLKRTWQLSIAGSGKFFGDDKWLHTFFYYDPERNISLGGLTRIHTVELDKLAKTLEKPVEAMSSLERWSVFMRYSADETKQKLLQAIWAHEEAIRMAVETVRGFSQDQIMYLRELSRQRQETAYRDALHEARDDGFAEGKAEGRAEGSVDGQLKLLALLESGKTIAEAKQLLGLNTD